LPHQAELSCEKDIVTPINVGSLFSNIPEKRPEELTETLFGSASIRIERIVSYGDGSPEGFWYDQDQPEWVCVLKGFAKLRFEEGTLEMKPGDFVNVPAHKKHRVEWTTPDEPTIWLAVHYGG
jgi:cupin 2 domain-containing protein